MFCRTRPKLPNRSWGSSSIQAGVWQPSHCFILFSSCLFSCCSIHSVICCVSRSPEHTTLLNNSPQLNPPMRTNNPAVVLLRGGGDLATGVALRLHRAGIKVLIAELAQPLAVRRAVSFAEAVYEGQHAVEGVTARLVKREQILAATDTDEIPVIIDPNAEILTF